MLKYIRGLHSYLRNSILVLKPSNLDEFCVQATHLESRGKGSFIDKFDNDNFVKKSSTVAEIGKGKKTTIVKKDDKLSCSHCERKGHDEDHCWKLHPKLKPKWAHKQNQKQKGKEKAKNVVMDHGSDSDDETKITTMGLKGKAPISSVSFDICASKPKVNEVFDDKKRNELFHIRVNAKNVKLDALIDSGSQVNLNFESFVKNLGLKTTLHKRPYPLGWICENDKLQVTRQCTLKFAITSKFVDEVQFDVVPLDICGIVLGIPYLYDQKYIFYREKNHYHLFKDGI